MTEHPNAFDSVVESEVPEKGPASECQSPPPQRNPSALSVPDRLVAAAASFNDVAAALDKDIDALKTGALSDALTYFLALKEAYAKMDTARKRVYKGLDCLNKSVVPDMFERDNTDKVQIPSVAKSFYPIVKTSVSMVDKEDAMDWLIAQGDGHLISRTVNAGTLSSYARDRALDKGVDLPEDMFRTNNYKVIGISSYKPKGL